MVAGDSLKAKMRYFGVQAMDTMDRRRIIPESWEGWTFWESYLIDPEGNRYSPDQVKTSLFTMELAHELNGSTLQIRSLKQELKRRLSTPPPKIIVQWGGEEVVINAPFWKLSG
jgi:hypothetical protein